MCGKRESMETVKDKNFYSVVGFKDITKWATFSKDGYVKKGNAQRVARNLIKKGYEHVVLRCETIWLKDEFNEFSESTPIEVYTMNRYNV